MAKPKTASKSNARRAPTAKAPATLEKAKPATSSKPPPSDAGAARKAKEPVSGPAPKVVTSTKPVVAAPDMKKKELIEETVARSGLKKREAKPAVEAVLAALGDAIAAGRELNLEPLGKLRINRSVEKSGARVVICKLRQKRAGNSPKDPLAEPSD